MLSTAVEYRAVPVPDNLSAEYTLDCCDEVCTVYIQHGARVIIIPVYLQSYRSSINQICPGQTEILHYSFQMIRLPVEKENPKCAPRLSISAYILYLFLPMNHNLLSHVRRNNGQRGVLASHEFSHKFPRTKRDEKVK